MNRLHSSFHSIEIALTRFPATSTSIISIGLISPQIALAQQQQLQANLTSVEQQQLMEGISFEIDNVTFSHHTASVNSIQLHYVIGNENYPITLQLYYYILPLNDFFASWYIYAKLCKLSWSNYKSHYQKSTYLVDK
jgi:hypothetical protein